MQNFYCTNFVILYTSIRYSPQRYCQPALKLFLPRGLQYNGKQQLCILVIKSNLHYLPHIHEACLIFYII